MSDFPVRETRETLARCLDSVDGLEGRAKMGNPEAGTGVILPGPTGEPVMGGAIESMEFTVRVYAGVLPEADEVLEQWMAGSVTEALRAASAEDAIEDLQVVRCNGYQLFPNTSQNEPALLGADWIVEVFI